MPDRHPAGLQPAKVWNVDRILSALQVAPDRWVTRSELCAILGWEKGRMAERMPIVEEDPRVEWDVRGPRSAKRYRWRGGPDPNGH